MTQIKNILRRLYNTALAVRHRTGRTEQLLIAMNNDAQHRNQEISTRFDTLQRAAQAESKNQRERNDFLFQSLKTLESRLQQGEKGHHSSLEALEKRVNEILNAQQQMVLTQKEQADLSFQAQKVFETSIGQEIRGQRRVLEETFEELRRTLSALAATQGVHGDRLALQSERDEFRFDSQTNFQNQLKSQQTHVQEMLEVLQKDFSTGQARLSDRLAQVEKTGSELRSMLLKKDNLRELAAIFSDRANRLGRIPKLKDVFHDYVEMVEEGQPFKLWGYEVSYLDRKSLWIQINELILREEYYFSDDFSAPHYIIDGGANIGLSILFFKALYPNAKIIAFEPNETCHAIAARNIRQNGLTDVTLVKAALGTEDGEVTLFVNSADSMGASVAPRHLTDDMVAESVTVPMVGLASYLDTTVDFLKLDIEGNEAEVLKSVQDKLGNVRNIFCEYHFSDEYKTRNKLRDIVDLLDDAKFDFQIAKSVWFGEHSEHRPVTYVGQDYSGVIYAKQRTPEGVE